MSLPTGAPQAHDQNLARAFDGQAARFERAPVQSDPDALRRLVAFLNVPAGSLVLDGGCGPGLVAEALLDAGHRVVGVDLSAEMIARARKRCERFSDRARFVQGSLFEINLGESLDAAVSRYVTHHLKDPLKFVQKQASLVRPGGVVLASDHTTDTDTVRAAWHQRVERARDHTHTANLTAGGLLDVMSSAGLVNLSACEEAFTLDFDEWFDRGTPAASKPEVRSWMAEGAARGFNPELQADGSIIIHCHRAMARGIRPDLATH